MLTKCSYHKVVQLHR